MKLIGNKNAYDLEKRVKNKADKSWSTENEMKDWDSKFGQSGGLRP